jgi:hypothetical protein
VKQPVPLNRRYIGSGLLIALALILIFIVHRPKSEPWGNVYADMFLGASRNGYEGPPHEGENAFISLSSTKEYQSCQTSHETEHSTVTHPDAHNVHITLDYLQAPSGIYGFANPLVWPWCFLGGGTTFSYTSRVGIGPLHVGDTITITQAGEDFVLQVILKSSLGHTYLESKAVKTPGWIVPKN